MLKCSLNDLCQGTYHLLDGLYRLLKYLYNIATTEQIPNVGQNRHGLHAASTGEKRLHQRSNGTT